MDRSTSVGAKGRLAAHARGVLCASNPDGADVTVYQPARESNHGANAEPGVTRGDDGVVGPVLPPGATDGWGADPCERRVSPYRAATRTIVPSNATASEGFARWGPATTRAVSAEGARDGG